MIERIYHFISGLLWRTLLTLLVGLAIAVSTTTVLLSMLPSVNDALTQAIEARTGLRADIGSLEGEMSGFRPKLKITDVVVYQGASQSLPAFQADELQITVNPWRSLLQRQLILSEWKARDVVIPARLENSAGSIVIPIDPGVFATEIERLTLQNTKVLLLRDQGEEEDRLLLEVDLDLRRDGSSRELQLSARGDGDLRINASGSGVGDPFDLRGFVGGINGRITAANIAAMASFFDMPISGRGDILFWTDAANGVFASTFQADGNVSIETGANSSNEIALSVLGVAESEGAGAWLNFDSLSLALDETQLSLNNLHLGLFDDEWALVMNDVDVAAAASTLLGTGLLPPNVVEKIQVMRPSGQIAALSLAGDYQQIAVKRAGIDIRNFGIIENTPLPGITNLSATVDYENGAGSLQVQSEDFSFSIPTQFREPLALGSVSALADFLISGDRIVIRDGRVFSDAGDFVAQGLISASLPLSANSSIVPELNVVLGAESAPSDRVLKFTPYKIDPEAYRWMQTSIGAGAAKSVGFVMRGGLRREDYPFRVVQLSALADLDAVQLMPGLPQARNLKGHVAVDNALVTFDLDSADVGTLKVPSALVQVGRVGGIQLLTTHADVAGSVPNAIREIASIPYVPDNVADALRRLETQGAMTAQFELSLPIKGAPRIPSITTRGEVTDARFSYTGLPLTVTQLDGDIVYQYPQGISGGTLSGMVFGDEIILDLNPHAVDLGLSAVGFSLSTRANLSVSNLSGLASLKIPDAWLSGTSEFSVAMQAGDGVRLQAVSDLAGFESTLPAPFDKKRGLPHLLRVDLDLSEASNLAVTYGDVMSGYAARKVEGWSGVAHIGDGELANASARARGLLSNTVEVGGRLSELDLLAWSDVITQFELSGTESGFTAQWQALEIDRVRLGVGDLLGVTTSGRANGSGLNVELASDFISGRVNYDPLDNVLSTKITELDLDQLPRFTDQKLTRQSDGLTIEPDLPHLSVAIDTILREGKDLGSLSFKMEATPESISLTAINGIIDGVTLGEKNQVDWTLGEGAATSASIDFQLGPAASTLSVVNTDSVVDFASGAVTGRLSWAGSPLDVALGRLDGNVNLELSKGSFLPVSSQATGPLRFISVFNLAGLVQRANVNQLFDPGLTFDKAKGDLALDGQRVMINEFSIRNGGGRLDLGGNFDIASEVIDAELTVTLPLVENIPWVAALAGGLPIAAGAYLASRVFEDQVTRLSSGVYSVTGPLDTPEVKFLRVFDARRSAEKLGSLERDQSSESDSGSDRK
jgi:uncharacterized protein YhdP